MYGHRRSPALGVTVEFGLLGPLQIRIGGMPVEIGAAKQRAVLIHLLLRVGETVPVDRLIDALWEDDAPPQARVTLRSYVSNLRRVLDVAGDDPVIVTRGNGYGLQIDPETVDAVRFARLVAQARDALAGGDTAGALSGLNEALGLWRGQALADVTDSRFATGERARLEELRLSATEDRFDVLLALGRHVEVVPSLEAFTADEPLRERAQAQLMLALYRSDRAADALAVFQRYREALVDELGLDPSPKLQDLADRILRQDAGLDAPAAIATAPAAAAPPARAASVRPDPLVGRVHERAELEAAVERLFSGTGSLLLIAGEAGIGKTTLLEELGRLAEATGVDVRWGRCQETRGAPAFWPWIQVLRDIAGELDDQQLGALIAGPAGPVAHLVDSISTRLGAQQPMLKGDLESARFQLYDAVAAFLLHMTEQRPLVLLLDDLHWADAPSLETLAFLTPLLGSGRLLIAGTYRDARGDWREQLEATLATVVREPSTQQLGLMGLQPDAVAELAERLTGEPLSEDQREVLHHRTGGNPFFVRQLSRLEAETPGEPGLASVIPSGVRHVIARRLNLLPEAARQLLETASVVGGEFDVRWLAGAAGSDIDTALDSAASAAEHGLIEAAGTSVTRYRFVHALVRETIYDGLAPLRAARMHGRVAEALEVRPHTPVATLAEHFRRAAELIDDDRPVRYLMAAAEQALGGFAHEQAETYLRQALELLADRHEDPAIELQVRVQLVQLLTGMEGWSSAAIEEVAAPTRHAARAVAVRPDLLPLWSGLFTMYRTRGDVAVARTMMEQFRAEADAGGSSAALAVSRIAEAQLDITRGDPARMVEVTAEAQQYAQQLTVPDCPQALMNELQVTAGFMHAAALAYSGDGPAALAAGQSAVALAEPAGDALTHATACLVVGVVGLIVGDPTFAAKISAQGLAICDQHGFELLGLITSVGNSCARARLGEDAAGHAQQMHDAIERIRSTGFVDMDIQNLLFTAEVHGLAGDHAAAMQCLAEAHELAATNGEVLPPEQLRRLDELQLSAVNPPAAPQSPAASP